MDYADVKDPFKVRGAVGPDPRDGASPRFPRGKNSPRTRSRCTDIAVAIVLPWLVFILVVGLFVLVYRTMPILVAVLQVVLAVLACLLACLGASVRHGTFLALGFMCFLSVAAGTALGLWLDSEYLSLYWRFDGTAEVSSVDPLGALKKTQDAGVIHFLPEAFVDDRRTVGFVAKGTIFCIAPVVMPTTPSSAVGYWAMGTDCCEKRSNFDCGSARVPDAQNTALVMIDQDPAFLEAISVAEAVYGVNSTAGAELVSFVADPKAEIGGIWDEALTIAGVGAAVDLCTCIVVGIVFGHVFAPRLQQLQTLLPNLAATDSAV